LRPYLTSLLSLALLAAAPITHSQTTPPLPAQPTHPWTVKDIFGGRSLTGFPPSGISWSPDGKHATYMDGQGNIMQVDVADGKLKKLIDHSKIAFLLNAKISEQDRDHRGRYGEPDYIWSPGSKHLLFDTNGELWLYDLRSGNNVQVGNSHMQSGDDPQFSPDGSSLSYVRDHNLFVQKVHGGAEHPVALTHTTDPDLLNGEIDWVYLEELNVRSNYFWSPDSKRIAYLQMDETHVPTYPITDWIPVHPTIEEQRYPQPGDPNPAVRVGVVNASGGKTFWLRIPLSAGNDYIPRFGWVNDHVVWVEMLTRNQKHMNIYFADARTGKVALALAQTDPKYFTTNYDVSFFGNQFVILSWRDGYTHMYRYTFNVADPLSAPAQLANQLEHGDYEVSKVGTIDQSTNTVYYVSNEGNPLYEQVWAVHLDGSGRRLVTTMPGVHRVDFPPKGGSFIDTASNMTHLPKVSYCTEQGTCTAFWHSHPLEGHTLTPPIPLTFTAADGKTTLYGTLQLPLAPTSPHSVPLIVNPYGGPGVGTSKDAWGGGSYYFNLLLAEHGFAVLHVDNRGMADRGRAFEQVCYNSFGPPQLADQLAAVDQVLAKYPQLDPRRLGFWGWSWGGTFTLYALTHSDRFRVGVSVAPVTDFRLYDSIYTERYLGLPSKNAKVYDDDAVSNSAKNLHGHVAIFHGTGDDNVHFANTIQFIQKLIDAGIPYDYNVFPRKTHSIAGPTARQELFNRIVWEFETYLKPAD
jgi:dipeptidyl-peptidase 4